MNTKAIYFWLTIMEKVGFKNIQHWQYGATNEWMGTLVIMGEKRFNIPLNFLEILLVIIGSGKSKNWNEIIFLNKFRVNY